MSAINVVIYNPLTGEVVQTHSTHNPDWCEANGYDKLVGVNASIGADYVDTATDPPTVRPIPPKPDNNHEFDYATKSWKLNLVIPTNTVRRERDNKLKSSDWTQLPDVAESTRIKWQSYRQALRDITSQSGFPLSVNWPTEP